MKSGEYPDSRGRPAHETLSLLDRGGSAGGADRPHFSDASSDDDTCFTVATVLRGSDHGNPFRKPTDGSSVSADLDGGVLQLRATASLMDSSDEESDAECDHVGSHESAFSLSDQQGVVSLDDDEYDTLDSSLTRRGGRRHSAERFNSIYSELAANKRQSLPASFAKRKRTETDGRSRVKTLSSTLKSLAAGISVRSWDEADGRRQRRRPLADIDMNTEVEPRIGRSLNVRDEVQLKQDQTQLCAELKRRLKRAEEDNVRLRKESKMTDHYKRLLKIAEEATHSDADTANERAESLSRELEDARREAASVQCELNAVRQVKDEALRQLQDARAAGGDSDDHGKDSTRNDEDQKQLEAVERKLGDCEKELALSKETAKRSVIAAESLAKSLDAANVERAELRAQVLSLKEENVKLQASHRETVQALVKENHELRDAKEQHETALRQVKDDWEREKLFLRNQNNLSTSVGDSSIANSPPGTGLGQINAYGAEDLSGDSNLRMHMSTAPDSSPKQLCFRAAPREGMCRVCDRACASGVSVRECQCGDRDCAIWVHTSCLANRKSVTKSLSHPGTPIPPERVILCRGRFCQ